MDNTRTSRSLFGGAALLMLGLLFAFLVIGSSAAKAETGTKALVLGSSVSGGASSLEATNATGNGFTVDVVDDATWGAMTAAQFADYQLIVVGDPTCFYLPQVVSQNATALADAVMMRAGSNTKVGNRILIGTDPVYHQNQGGSKLVETGIDFAGVQEGASGLYLDFTCGDPDYDGNGIPDGQDKLLPLLTIDPTPGWTQNTDAPCGGSVSLISNANQFSTLTSTDLQGWFCSVHESFPQFPSDWNPLAIATDTPTAPTCGNDVDTGAAVCGEAYILIAGSGIVVVAPNLSLDPTTATNPVGTQHTVTATVTNPDGTPRSGVVVSFVVTGANAGAAGTCVPADCTTGADGKVAFTYTGTNEGDDTINAAITVDGSRQTATAAKTWMASTSSADLSVTKSDTPDPVTVGQELTYTITVANAGPSSAENVTVTDTLPTTVTFVSATPSQGTCSGTATVTCLLGTIASGASATVTIKVTPTTDADLSNTATVSATTADPNTANNTDTETTVVNAPPSADLSVTKSDSPDPVLVGAELTYTLTVSNAGPDPAAGVTLTDALPGTVTFVSATPSQGTCSGTTTVTCLLGTIASGASATVTIKVTPTTDADLSNTATVSATTADPSSANNSDTELTTVNPAPPSPSVGALSPGYWKTHQAQTTALLPITLGNYTVSTFAQATAVFHNMNCGNSSQNGAAGCLAGQLLAAKLNVKNGAGTCIAPMIANADAFLVSINYVGPSGTYSLSAAQRALAIQLKDALDKYNNGLGC